MNTDWYRVHIRYYIHLTLCSTEMLHFVCTGTQYSCTEDDTNGVLLIFTYFEIRTFLLNCFFFHKNN